VSVDTIGGGRYRVERVLGDGAMAKVVLAEDGELGRQVAVKLLDQRLAADASFRARFAREARAAASLSHPNVVGVFDVGEAEGRPFIVMEHVEGQTLEERLRRDGALAPSEVCRIGRQICAGLEHAHSAGLVHRDLKPGNLIERRDGTIKIADFGIARLDETTELTEAGAIVGTAAYLAPEQAEAGEITQATDVFTLGVVLYELLTGRQPWKVESLAELARRRHVAPAELPPDTPGSLREAIERSLDPDPLARPTVAGLAELLDAPDDDATLVIPRPRFERRRQRRLPRAVWVALLAGAALVLGAVAASFATRGDDGASSGTTVSEVQPLRDGATASEDARNLAEWLRRNARSG
jgi:eukaryotic-like serine/threonine-protein kinase